MDSQLKFSGIMFKTKVSNYEIKCMHDNGHRLNKL